MTRLIACLAALLLAALPARAATDVVEVTSPGGITAWLVQEDSIPMLALNIHFRGGGAVEPDDKLGVTNLMMGLLEEGAGNYDSTGFAARAQELAARFSFSGGRDGVDISATVLTEFRAESLDLLALALKQPTFSQEAVERVRAQVISNLRANETDPNWIASREFATRAYAGHPYARPTDGTIETVTALTREDIVTAHRQALSRDRLIVGVVGDITPEELGPLLDRLFEGLPETGPELPPVAEVIDASETVVVPFDSPQSVVRFGHSGIPRRDDDFLAAYVMNQVLGAGGYSSRLGEEVREKRGLTYGIYSYLASSPFGSLYMGAVASSNATVAEAIEVTRAEWRRMAEEGITAEELAAAKRYLTGAYPLRFDGNGRIAGILVGMQLVGLDTDYIAGRNAMVEALTLDEVNRVAAELLKPDKLRVVVVGRPEGLDATQ